MLDIDWSIVIMTIINASILVLILKHFLWDKIKSAVSERESYIGDKLAQADSDTEKARMYLVENERIMNNAKSEGKKIIEDRKAKANKVYSEIVAEANKEAAAILERARIEISREKEKAEYELKKQVVNLAIELSTKALEEKIEETKQRELISDFITKVGS